MCNILTVQLGEEKLFFIISEYGPCHWEYNCCVCQNGWLNWEIFAQVNFFNLFIRQNNFWLAFGNEFALAKDIGSIANTQGLTDIVIGYEHANSTLL